MAVMNQWDDDVPESIGDEIYDTIEEKIKDEAKDAAKKGTKAAGKALDKLAGRPVARLKAAIQKAKQKVKEAAAKAAKEGLKAAWAALKAAAKWAAGFAARHPVIAAIIIIIVILIIIAVNAGDEEGEDEEDGMPADTTTIMVDSMPGLDRPVYLDTDKGSMSDEDIVVILMEDCVEQQYDAVGGIIAISLEKEEQAKDIYSVFHDMGFNNVSIAGILANLDCESGLDPTAIEGIFSDYGVLSPKKAAAFTSISAYTEGTLFETYRSMGKSIDHDVYKTVDSYGDVYYYCGIGLTQWTGVNAKSLVTAAENLGVDWYDLSFQLGYMASDAFYQPGFFAAWKDDQEDDYSFDEDSYHLSDYASQADYEAAVQAGKEAALAAAIESAKASALKFAHDWVVNSSNDAERQNAAVSWYTTIADWGDDESDSEYADSITALATNLAGIGEFLEIEEAQYRCLGGNLYDNSTLSSAGMSFAWPRRELSYNNGTNLYQLVLKTIFPHSYTFKACDNAVAGAVVWSGTDLDYVLYTPDQLNYLAASPKWTKVGDAGSLSISDLEPGDVFIVRGHTFLYVGEESIQAAYAGEADPGSNSVSASLGERSAGCDMSVTKILGNGGMDFSGRGMYQVYRCTSPDNSDKWSSIGAGVTE